MMSRLTPLQSSSTQQPSSSFNLWPLPLWLVLCCLPLLPSSCFIDLGYTKWWLWGVIVYGLTQDARLPPFLAVQGLWLNVGWYMALGLDYLEGGRLLHILFRNMPEFIYGFIIDGPNVTGQEIVIQQTTASVIFRLVCVALDLCIHPLLCYYFWRCCWKSGKTLTDICSWRVLASALILSRTWSIVHCWIHHDKFGLYYYGNDVYSTTANSDPMWTAAYVGETIALIGLLVACKLRSGCEETSCCLTSLYTAQSTNEA